MAHISTFYTQAQCLSSRSQDGGSTPASPSAAALRKAAEVALTVEEVVEETVQVHMEEAAAAAVDGEGEGKEADKTEAWNGSGKGAESDRE